jgi:hypothetical protein
MPIRVAFVNLQLGGELPGLTRAIVGQARAAKESNLPIDFWVINPDREKFENDIHYKRFKPSHLGERATRLFRSRLLAGFEALDDYDVALLRYPLAIDLDPLALLRSRRCRIATVHHTKEVEEILSWRYGAGSHARAMLERVNGRRFLSRVDGISAVTDEIRQYELKRAGRFLPSRTISNGIDVRSVPLTGFIPFNGDELKLLFIASSHAPWHGTERLLASMRAYRGPVKIVLNMVGDAAGSAAGMRRVEGPLTIINHGVLHGEALEAVFSDVALAISTLAMFRIGLREGCVLKTREYLARGLPFVYGYEDTDLTPDLPFCRSVGSSPRPFSVDELISFASTLSKQQGISQQMRSWAEAHIDWRIKMRAYYDFASKIAALCAPSRRAQRPDRVVDELRD